MVRTHDVDRDATQSRRVVQFNGLRSEGFRLFGILEPNKLAIRVDKVVLQSSFRVSFAWYLRDDLIFEVGKAVGLGYVVALVLKERLKNGAVNSQVPCYPRAN